MSTIGVYWRKQFQRNLSHFSQTHFHTHPSRHDLQYYATAITRKPCRSQIGYSSDSAPKNNEREYVLGIGRASLRRRVGREITLPATRLWWLRAARKTQISLVSKTPSVLVNTGGQFGRASINKHGRDKGMSDREQHFRRHKSTPYQPYTSPWCMLLRFLGVESCCHMRRKRRRQRIILCWQHSVLSYSVLASFLNKRFIYDWFEQYKWVRVPCAYTKVVGNE